MSKKSRRERTPNLPPEAFNVPAASPKAAAASGDVPAAAVVSTTAGANRKATPSAVVDWKAEYGEVIGDLRRTFIIFAGLVVAMIALSFVIR